ncbi:hypothetical protein CDAR_61841 [Caerostris darwini]|uniref:Uncharacterized protein n=1 Tax=Caerostris darwini TaxID=1538125 RepID=A0AAV4VL48_9ARAC|nr:hypothetical protein CDAR_61841 [Caerostris darwini]
MVASVWRFAFEFRRDSNAKRQTLHRWFGIHLKAPLPPESSACPPILNCSVMPLVRLEEKLSPFNHPAPIICPPTCTLADSCSPIKCSSELEPESIRWMGDSKFISGFNFARLCMSAHIKLLCNATRAIGVAIQNASRVLLLISSLLSNE